MAADLALEANNIVPELLAIVGNRGVLLGEDVRARSCDPFRPVPPAGPAIVRPADTAEVAAVLACCHRHRQRVVTHGGRTGVAGGAYGSPDEIVLSLERMSRIEEIDPVGQVAVVQAGVSLEALQNAAVAQYLFYPVDLGARGTATVGGTIATNAGGNRVIRWGTTRHNILGIEAVLADGTVVTAMNRLLKNNTGYDLKHYFAGSEGTLGVVTRAVMRLVPMPRTQLVAFLSLSDFNSVLALLGQARRLPILSAFEVMWQDYYALVAGSHSNRAPLPADQPYYVLVEAMGYNDDIDTSMFNGFLESVYEAGLVSEVVSATSGRQVADLWRVREGSEIIVREMSPFISFDISVDARRAEEFVNAAYAALGARYRFLRTTTFGHLGDSNLHLGVHTGAGTLDEAENIERCVYRVVEAFGGALTAEHGIGQFKKAFLPDHVSPGALEAMRRVRAGLDPARLLNRDVLF
jgi:FAD/FMN-containing dehydrogenase